MVSIQIKLDNHLKTQVDLASSSINNGRVGEVKTYKHYFAITIQKYSDNFKVVAESTKCTRVVKEKVHAVAENEKVVQIFAYNQL